ncbi:MAG TPA: transaldolase family protein [Pelolinea sp.]|nr:transaldolase family protein [Pelolinea sp.]
MKSYFHRVHELTPTKFWINNPTREEADWALAEGASGCTCNPSYCGKMLFDRPGEEEYASQLLDEIICEVNTATAAEEELQRRLVRPIAEKFMPIYEKYHRENGYVSIQGDPINEHDPEVIIREARKNRTVSENICCKIPTTESGLKAMETLVVEDIPINATEVFAIQQALDLCELFEKVSNSSGKHPKFYISHITGIYDEYLREVAERDEIDISPDILWQAGLSIARKLYQIYIDRGYHVTFIGGGARGTQHFTEMIGGDVCVTINWSGTADKLLEEDPPVVERLFNPVPEYVIEELSEKLPDYRRGYFEGEITSEEYDDFGPLVKFRNSFIKDWNQILGEAQKRLEAKS